MPLPRPTMSHLPPAIPTMTQGDMIAHGFYADRYHPFEKTGYNPDVNNVEESMWVVGGTFLFPAIAQQMEVVSSSAADTSNGTGAQKVKISYLDTTYAEQTEVITLNGVTAVPTVATNIFRINHFRVESTGTGLRAAGNIDIRHLSDTPIYSRISTGLTRARNSAYTVPKGKELYITSVSCSSAATLAGHFTTLTLRAKYDSLTGDISLVSYPFFEITLQDSVFAKTFVVPLRFPALVDIQVTAIADASNASTICGFAYLGYTEAEP